MERPGSSGEQEKIFAVETQVNLSHWWVSLYFQHHIPIINNNHSSSEFVYSKSTDQCCFLNSSLTCIRSTPSLFLPVFLSPPSPSIYLVAYVHEVSCSQSLEVSLRVSHFARIWHGGTYQHYALFDFRPVFRSIHFQFAAKGFSRFWILSSYNLVFLGSAYGLFQMKCSLVG